MPASVSGLAGVTDRSRTRRGKSLPWTPTACRHWIFVLSLF